MRGPYSHKRFVDLAVLVVVAVPALLLGSVAAVWVKVTSRGPVFFRQDRVGRDGELFECLKFRTMIDGDNPLIPDASRITSAGVWLRRFSLDELPQLICVARGDMSIVGPRPMLPFQAERCDQTQRQRVAVRPGLTGLAQISGRNALLWARRMELDLEYIETQSPRTDVSIILRTAGALLSADGVEGHDETDPFVIDLTKSVGPVPANASEVVVQYERVIDLTGDEPVITLEVASSSLEQEAQHV